MALTAAPARFECSHASDALHHRFDVGGVEPEEIMSR
jgi:hypothetical protein